MPARASAKIAVYLSRHGYGHLVRTAEVCRVLSSRHPVTFELISDLPADLWPASLRPLTERANVFCDAGVVQSDDFTVDRIATAARLEGWAGEYPAALEREEARLRKGFDLVLGDVPPLAFQAAKNVGLPSVAMANFSWDWIYENMGFVEASVQAASAYSHADLLLELSPAAPMPAFSRRRNVGLLGRSGSTIRWHIREQLGLRLEQRAVLIALRNGGYPLVQLPPPGIDLVWVVASSRPDCTTRSDVMAVPEGVEWPDLVAACDAVVSKPGYGIIGDTAATGTPLLYAPRSGFPEDPILEAWLRAQPAAAQVAADRLRSGEWLDDLCALLSLERPLALSAGGADAAVDELLALLSFD